MAALGIFQLTLQNALTVFGHQADATTPVATPVVPASAAVVTQ